MFLTNCAVRVDTVHSGSSGRSRPNAEKNQLEAVQPGCAASFRFAARGRPWQIDAMTEIIQTETPYDPDISRGLPGMAPLAVEDWLLSDEVFAPQMAERARLLHERRNDVLAVMPGAEAACDELLETVLGWLADHGRGYVVGDRAVRRPDGVTVTIDRTDPLGTLGNLVQEDLCLMERHGGDEHVLTAAVLCFPASWRLADKIGRPLSEIHVPVPEYDAGLARRVQRLFDGVQVGRPMWRFNRLNYAEADLFQPVSRRQPSVSGDGQTYPFLRTERQCVLRLPGTRACVFSIHSYVLRRQGAPGVGGQTD